MNQKTSYNFGIVVIYRDRRSSNFDCRCDIVFNGVLASINHYETPKHDKEVNRYIIDRLFEHDCIDDEEADKPWVDNVIKRILKVHE